MKGNFYKVVLNAFLGVLLSFTASQTASASVSDAIDHISSGPTSLSTANREVFSGGSLRMFVPQETTQFVSITPPSYSAGCSGIDAAFGGFSFVNGEKLKQMVKTIMSSAKGYALDLAIRTLCPLCSDVMQKIRDVSNWANNLALDSCGAAKFLVDSVATMGGMDPDNPSAFLYGSDSGTDEDTASDICKNSEGATGGGGWFEDTACAAGSAMATLGSQITEWTNGINAGKSWQEMTAGEKTEADNLVGQTNKTYAALIDAGYRDRDQIELIMSLIGTQYVNGDGAEIRLPGWASLTTVRNNPSEAGTAAENAATQFLNLLKFGTGMAPPDLSANPELEKLGGDVVRIIDNLSETNQLPYYECVDVGATVSVVGVSDYLKCRNVVSSDVHSSVSRNVFISEDGYVQYVVEQLVGAADVIRGGGTFSSEQLSLINMAPLPVYRMLKVSVLYPQAGQSLISTYSELIAVMLIREQINALFQVGELSDNRWNVISPFVEAVNASINKIAMNMGTVDTKTIVAELAVVQQLQGVLAQVDRVIAERAIQSGAAGASLFSRRMAPSNTPGN
jgi:hypothetical protein